MVLTTNLNEDSAKIVTIAGESGSGKTTLARCILGDYPLSRGEILYKGKNIASMKKREIINYRREVQAIFQDPYDVYNPFYRVSHVFDIVVKGFGLASNKKEAAAMVEEALAIVGLRGGEVLDKYPHQLSGGQKQRIMVARACMLRPKIHYCRRTCFSSGCNPPQYDYGDYVTP